MKALRFDGASVGLRDVAEPVVGAGEALIRPLKMGVASPDLAAAAGRLVFRGTLGHEFVGVVEKVGSAELSKWVGKRVVGGVNVVCGKCERCRGGLSNHCQARQVLGLHGRDGCFAERFTLPVVNLCEVPRAIDDEQAVFAGVVAGVLHASQMIRFEGKPFVTVLGDGVVGLLAAQVMARLNASVRLLGKHPEKFTLCEKWGVKHRHVGEVGRRMDQDIVVDCTGKAEGLELALQLVRPRGKVIVKSVPALVPVAGLVGKGVGVDMAAAVCNEVEVIGAGSGVMADGLAAVGGLDVRSLVSGRVRLGAQVLEKSAGTIKVLVEM